VFDKSESFFSVEKFNGSLIFSVHFEFVLYY
jgi:hypothetical protein